MQRTAMLSRVCVQQRENRGEKWGKSDYFSVVKLFQSLLSPFCQEMRLTQNLRAGRHRRFLPVFQTPHHVLSEKNFFPRLCVTTLKSSSASNFAWTSFVFTKASGSLEQRRNLFWFSHENLWCLTFDVVALHVYGEKFLRLMWDCCNCKDNRERTQHPSSITRQFGFQICFFRWMKAVMTVKATQSRLLLIYLTSKPYSVWKLSENNSIAAFHSLLHMFLSKPWPNVPL